MTEQQPYDAVQRHSDFELRRYPDHLVAETEVGGPFELAGNIAFPSSRGTSGVTTGPPRYARFDPPWTPWFMRRNEVVIPVRADGRPDDPTREGELRDG